jgi:hypothetical protein
LKNIIYAISARLVSSLVLHADDPAVDQSSVKGPVKIS